MTGGTIWGMFKKCPLAGLALIALATVGLVVASQGNPKRRTTVRAEVNQLEVRFSVNTPVIDDPQDLQLQVTLTNQSKSHVRLNALFLDIPKVLLEVRRADGAPVHPGPPPMPPTDDGKEGRVGLSSGQSVTYQYRGSQYFGAPLPPGIYQVRFRYENTVSEHQDWTGSVQTAWANFEVRK
jgi:hypothetical protein